MDASFLIGRKNDSEELGLENKHLESKILETEKTLKVKTENPPTPKTRSIC